MLQCANASCAMLGASLRGRAYYGTSTPRDGKIVVIPYYIRTYDDYPSTGGIPLFWGCVRVNWYAICSRESKH